MTLLVVAAMALFGGTTWLALQQPIARDPGRNRHLTTSGLALCLLVVVAALLVAIVKFVVTV